MKRIEKIAVLVAATALSACGADHYTDSGFASVSPTGEFSQDLDSEQSGGLALAGTGFVFHTGALPNGDGFLGEAGILPTSNVGALPVSGTIGYAGQYQVGLIENIELSGNLLTGTQDIENGSIFLTASIDEGTITGTSDNSALVVNGTVSGGNIGGSVTYNGQSGDLDGIYGEDAAVGIFHGNNAETIFAGGFLVLD